MPSTSALSTTTPPSESVHQFPEKAKIDESVSSHSTQSSTTSSPALTFDSNGPSPPPSGLASKTTLKAPIEKMFETFHQSPSGEFKPTFYNPFEVKHRRRTSKSQFRILERAFQANSKPNADIRTALAAELNMTTRSIQVWFQNRRAKLKNQVKGGKSTSTSTHSSTESESSEGEMDQCEENDMELLAKITGKRSFSATTAMETTTPTQITVPGPELMPNGTAIPNQQRSRSHSLPDLQRSPQLPFRQLQEALFGNNESVHYGSHAQAHMAMPRPIPALQPQAQHITPQMIAASTCFRYPFTTATASINPQQTFQVDSNRLRSRPRSSSFTLPRQVSSGYAVNNPGGLASISEQSPHGHLYPEASFFTGEEVALSTQMSHVDLDYYMVLGQSAMNYNPLDYSSSASQSPIDSSYLLDPAEMAFLPQPSNEILLSTLIDDKHFE